MVAIIGMIGLVSDLGWARYVRTGAQTAADAAATAAAEYVLNAAGQTTAIACGTNAVCQTATPCPYPVPSPPTNNIQAGCLYAGVNGFSANGTQTVTVAANTTSPPPSAAGVQTSYWVTVSVKQSVPQFFSAVFGNTTATVGAHATSAIVGAPGAPCVYALAPTGGNAFVASGGSQVTIGCGIQVNSSDNQALVSSGGSCITANAVSVVGNWTGGCVTPAPVTSASSVSDPYATSPAAPTYGACDHIGYSTNTSASLSPGVYCNGITINGGTATLSAGNYILDGGGLTVNGNATLINGSGVNFYNTADHTYAFKPIAIQGGSTATLSAGTSGPLAGFLFFQDRSIVSSSKNTVSGGGSATLTGILYFPTTQFDVSGGSNLNPSYMSIVATVINFSGGASIKNYNEMSNPLVARSAALIE